MSEIKLTPEQYAQIVEQNKPHLIAIEEQIMQTDNGSIELKIDVRQGTVNKITFFNQRYWFKTSQKVDTK